MPYYQELFVNRAHTSRYGIANTKRLVVTDQALVMSFRTRPHPAAVSRRQLTDQSVDPYAYFISSTDRKRYTAALEARGLTAAKGRPDNGHPFTLLRHTVTGSRYNARAGGQSYFDSVMGYTGSELDTIHTGDWLNIPDYGPDGLPAFSQQAYARVAPTSVVFDAANFLGELREGLPRLASQALRDSSRFFKGLGGDYLNIQFGWLPFLKDIQNAALALQRATTELAQQGQRVHRRYSVPAVSSNGLWTGSKTLVPTAGSGIPNGLIPTGMPIPSRVMGEPYGVRTNGTGIVYNDVSFSKAKVTERWFEGEFSHFYPLGFDPSNYFDRLNVLVNTRITPETLWNLAPWSWLVDWNLRIGDSIRSNTLRANELLIMHYGYSMEKTVYTTSTHAAAPSFGTDSYGPRVIGNVAQTTRMRRIRANPYGFKVGGPSALTGGQLAILGALGLTKAL